MLTKTLAWGIILIFVACAVWWFMDPVGFSHNAVFSYLRQLGLRFPGYQQ